MNLAATTRATDDGGHGEGALPPETIAEKFPQLEIIECLGRGGMGVVYKARQPLLDRLVALKILAPGKEKDPQFAERFTREAQALARLSHPNIVAVHDFGETGGLYYLLMEYVDGMTLRRLLASGKLAPAQALTIVPRICEALQFAHERGVVHRDIKPENVLLDKQGRVKIADFGIAKLVGETSGPAAFYTKGRMVVGTPYYMAPEQVENPLEVDHRADIYSLGVVFYEMLTGELPLGRFDLPSQKVQVDVRLDEVVLHALEKQPARRYQQASEVKTDLDTIAGGAGKVAASSTRAAGPQPAATKAASATTPLAEAPVQGGSRLSRLAVAGAAWIAIFFVVMPFFVMHEAQTQEFERGGPFSSLLAVFAYFGILFPAMVAPFGATILGWVAVAQIRRSPGRLYGLGLAVFDGLVFPLLLLDGVVMMLCYFATIAVAGGPEVSNRDRAIFYFATLLISLVADYFVTRRVWRAVSRATDAAAGRPQPAMPAPKPGMSGWGIAGIIVGVLCLLVLGAAGMVALFVMAVKPVVRQRVAVEAQSAREQRAAQSRQQALEANVRQAQEALSLATQKFNAGLATQREVLAAQGQLAAEQEELIGDAAGAAQARLLYARRELDFVEQQYKAGLVDGQAMQAAKAKVAQLQAKADAIEMINASGAQNDATGQPVPAEMPAAPAPSATQNPSH
jgi:hypothetical protein